MSSSRATVMGLGAAAAAAGVAAVALGARRRAARHEPLAQLRTGERSKLETSDGAILEVHVAGEGPTVVLAHCWTGDMRIWEPVAAQLVDDGHRVVRYDQRGHGASTIGADGCSIERLGHDLAELLEHLDLRDVVVAGHSMGGMTAQAFAIEHPETVAARVRALLLVSTASAELGDLPLARLAPSVIGRPSVDRALASPAGRALLRGALGKGANPHAVRLTRDTFLGTSPEVRLAQLHAMTAMDLRHGRKGIAVPTTVVVGTRDTLTPPAFARDIADAIPSAQLVTVPGAGHMLPLESTDLLVELIEEAVA